MSGLTTVSDDELLASLPRGVRNRNPGNIEDGDFARSLPGYKGSDGRFAIFDSMDSGTKAQARLLGSYGQRGINTVEGVVNRWAPKAENNTDAYVGFVAEKLGVDPRQPLDMADERVLTSLAEVMAEHENGAPVRGPDLSAVPDAELLASLGPSGQPKKPPPIGGPAALRPDDALGFLKGSFKAVDNGANWLEAGIRKGAPGLVAPLAGVGAKVRGALPDGLVNFIDNPQGYYDAQAAKGVRPGKLGEFAGNVAGTSFIPGGPLVQGAVGGALLSEKKDLRGVAGDAALGGVAGRLTAAGSDALQLGARKLLSKAPQIPTLAELETTKKALYKAATDSGFTFKPADVRALSSKVTAELRARAGPAAAGGLPVSNMLTRRLAELSKQPGGVTLAQLDLLRSDAYKMAVANGGPESIIGGFIRREIDNVMDAYKTPLIREARAANAKWEKVLDITERVESGRLAAASANSGRNVVNAKRAKIRPTIDPLHSSRVGNYTPDEAKAVDRVVSGSPVGNFYRETGNFLRNPLVSSGGMMLGGLAGLGGGPAGSIAGGLAIPAGMQVAGHSFRRAAEKAGAKDIDALIRLLSVGGSKQALGRVPTKMSAETERAIARLRPLLVGASVPAIAAAKRKEDRK